jgi:TRAP transporter 4TM/12TM fusion protein
MKESGYPQVSRRIFFLASLGLLFYHTYYIVIGVPFLYVLACWHMMLVCIGVFFSFSWTGKEISSGRVPFFGNLLLSALVVLSFSYLIVNYQDMIEAPEIGLQGKIVGCFVVVVILEACRRVLGLALPMIAVCFILYSRFGEHFPDLISTQSKPFLKIFEGLAFSNFGIFGTPLIVSSSIIFYFILLGSFMEATGSLSFFNSLATALTGRRRGGQAKAAVVASGFVAMISGSAVANVVMTGTVTIPMMKKAGYRNYYAAAVEAVSSSGGQLAPPVMGAAAFIMAMYTGIQYRDICLSAALPAFLFYLSIYIAVHIEAVKLNIIRLSASELPKIKESLPLFYNLIPIGALLYLILTYYPPALCAFYSFLLVVAIGVIKKGQRLGLSRAFKAIERNARSIAPVSCACAVAGIVVGVITMTGLGLVISTVIIDLSGGNRLLILAFTAVASLILGMGLPTSACYIILAVLVAPALVKMGFTVIAAHMFVFYFGIISAITPPVALASYAAAGLANADPTKTGFYSVRIGIAKFLVPFIFCYNPGLVGVGGTTEVLLTAFFSILCIFALQFLVSNYTFIRNSIIENILFLVEIPLFIAPDYYVKLLASLLFSVNIAISVSKKRASAGFQSGNHEEKDGSQLKTGIRLDN